SSSLPSPSRQMRLGLGFDQGAWWLGQRWYSFSIPLSDFHMSLTNHELVLITKENDNDKDQNKILVHMDYELRVHLILYGTRV
ncbi:hypothetical protein ACJX0J_016982, partial [Zea mays]